MPFDFEALVKKAVEARAREAAERHDDLIAYLNKVRDDDTGRKVIQKISNLFETEVEHRRDQNIVYEEFLHSLLGKD